jgi:hypothetical protein
LNTSVALGALAFKAGHPRNACSTDDASNTLQTGITKAGGSLDSGISLKAGGSLKAGYTKGSSRALQAGDTRPGVSNYAGSALDTINASITL